VINPVRFRVIDLSGRRMHLLGRLGLPILALDIEAYAEAALWPLLIAL